MVQIKIVSPSLQEQTPVDEIQLDEKKSEKGNTYDQDGISIFQVNSPLHVG